MTEEQYVRAQFIHDLKRLVDPDWMQMQYRDLPHPTPDHFWVHATDMPVSGRAEFWSAMVEEKLVEPDPAFRYEKRGDWMDYYPPFMYKLTAKGRRCLDNPGDYVYAEGGADEQVQS